MKLEFDIISDCGLKININGINRCCHTDKLYMDIENSETVKIQITQLLHKRRWYLFALYFLEGIFTALLCGYSRYCACEYLHPYLSQCVFTVRGVDCCKITVSSALSKVNSQGECVLGFVTVDGNDISDVQLSNFTNYDSFSSVFIKTIFTIMSMPLILLGILLFIFVKSERATIGSIIIMSIVILLLLSVCLIKIFREREKLKSVICNICDISGKYQL